MTAGDRERLDTIRSRIDHVAATARLVADLGDLPVNVAATVAGVSDTLLELAERMDDILSSALRQPA